MTRHFDPGLMAVGLAVGLMFYAWMIYDASGKLPLLPPKIKRDHPNFKSPWYNKGRKKSRR